MKSPQYAVRYKIKTDWLSGTLSFQFKYYFNITILFINHSTELDGGRGGKQNGMNIV